MKAHKSTKAQFLTNMVYSYLVYTTTLLIVLTLMGSFIKVLDGKFKEALASMLFASVFVAPLAWFTNVIFLFVTLRIFKRLALLNDRPTLLAISVAMGALPITTFIPLALLELA